MTYLYKLDNLICYNYIPKIDLSMLMETDEKQILIGLEFVQDNTLDCKQHVFDTMYYDRNQELPKIVNFKKFYIAIKGCSPILIKNLEQYKIYKQTPVNLRPYLDKKFEIDYCRYCKEKYRIDVKTIAGLLVIYDVSQDGSIKDCLEDMIEHNFIHIKIHTFITPDVYEKFAFVKRIGIENPMTKIQIVCNIEN